MCAPFMHLTAHDKGRLRQILRLTFLVSYIMNFRGI